MVAPFGNRHAEPREDGLRRRVPVAWWACSTMSACSTFHSDGLSDGFDIVTSMVVGLGGRKCRIGV